MALIVTRKCVLDSVSTLFKRVGDWAFPWEMSNENYVVHASLTGPNKYPYSLSKEQEEMIYKELGKKLYSLSQYEAMMEYAKKQRWPVYKKGGKDPIGVKDSVSDESWDSLVVKKKIADAVSSEKLKEYEAKIKWGIEKDMPFAQGYVVNDLIKRYKIRATEWGYATVGTSAIIGVGTAKQRMIWKDKGVEVEFMGIINKDGSVSDSLEISKLKPGIVGMYNGAQVKVLTVDKNSLEIIEVDDDDKPLPSAKKEKVNKVQFCSQVAVFPGYMKDSVIEDRTYSEATGPYKKGSLVVKKKKKEPITQVPDAKKYGDLNPGEASVMIEISEEGKFSESSLKLATGLEKRGFITFKDQMSGGGLYSAKLTKKGEQWLKDYEDGVFDSELIDEKNLGFFGEVQLLIEDDGSLVLKQGSENIRLVSKKFASKLAAAITSAIKNMG